LIGTVEYAWAGKSIASFMTTPDKWNLYSLLDMMAADGVTHAVMEVSSHALALGRLDGLRLALAGYTNLGRDHLDFHHDAASYAAAKAKIFSLLDDAKKAVYNADDAACRDAVAGKDLHALGFALEHDAPLRPKDPRIDTHGMALGVVWQGKPAVIVSKLKGVFNAYNVLCAVACALQLGLSIDEAVRGVADAPAPCGRLEEVVPGVFVDYAHKPDAMENVLTTLKAAGYTGIVTVFGCGGDRDRGKRPIMADVASKYSRYVVLTNDNPRTEDPERIFADIMPGVRVEHRRIDDRAAAIAHALSVRKDGEAVLIAGKGHEDYQIFGTSKVHFSDQETVLATVGHHV
jgi:UDP-N-acetylmuramoyl-L-alanyl-D-glutamate--2,6-diaminopimelate ligase